MLVRKIKNFHSAEKAQSKQKGYFVYSTNPTISGSQGLHFKARLLN
jgi:hypothetical protein